MRNKLKKSGFNNKGFTLAEALLATALLSIATAGAVLPFTCGAKLQAEGIHRTVAACLADDLMQRIVVEDFDNIVGLYDGYVESEGQITDAAGNVIDQDGYARFSREVACEKVYLSQQGVIGAENFILVNVKVYYNGNKLAEVERLICE